MNRADFLLFTGALHTFFFTGGLPRFDSTGTGEYATGYALATPRSSFAATEENARKSDNTFHTRFYRKL